ncbi:intermembrane transport protein PqiB [Marinomonas rhizomae]|uniref:Paraquat-inducible protein B n=1 Tax=Marinomonas rhizomae TaxID=491948 RepID=A0A366IUS9_9GAMM|nr:intermembrane transport protein PqiB [Marinomonas rhizomae]RBP77940.1 paraquat-inducible protein B [Marinomonas rhizomae]RNF68918.1 intermembrane transport protein PqiB [Marinomonas rhizomae]
MSAPNKQVESMRQVRFNSIWLVPLIALLVAGWMLYQNWSSQGPIITLVAANADGLEVGKTKLKSRNVDVGRVIDIRLSPDYEKAIIQVRMNYGTEQMLRDDAKFWVVKPRVGKEGVSGLGTLLSGAYIDMTPGVKGRIESDFTLLSQPPLSTENEGVRLVLSSTEGSKLDVGALVHFRGYEVGYVEKVGFDADKGAITYRIVVRSPYDSLVNSGVQFWMTPGLSFKSSASGFEVRLDSLETFFAGGISFGLPPGRTAGQPVNDMAAFRLYSSKESAANNMYSQFINYVFLFDSNISGLTPGAAVEFRGVRIGTVLDVPFNGIPMDSLASLGTPLIPVRARIEPQRLNFLDTSEAMSLQKWNELIEDRINKGVRATLKIGNYLNGAKVINIDFMKNPPAVKIKEFAGYQIFPTAPDALANIETRVGDILDNVSQVPLNKTFEQLGQTMSEANETLRQLQELSKSVKQLLDKSETQQLPTDLAATINELNLTLETYQANGQIGRPLKENMVSLGRALNELQPLLRQLRENPNTLIFDSKPRVDVQPKAAK